MAGIMSDIGDLNRLVGGALSSPEKPIPSIAPKKEEPVAPALKESTAVESGAEAIRAGGFAPLSPVMMGRAEEKAKRDIAEGIRSTEVMPSATTAQNAMNTAMALFGMDIDDVKEATKSYNQLLPNFEKKVLEARQLYEKKEEELGAEQAKVAMFKILGHLALGIYGAQNGVDTSGIKFDTVDWAARHQKLLNEYKMDVDLEESRYRMGVSRAERIEALAKMAMMQGEKKAAQEAQVKSGQIAAENEKLKLEYQAIREQIASGGKTETEMRRLADRAKALEEKLAYQEAKTEKTAQSIAEREIARSERMAMQKAVDNFSKATKPDAKNTAAEILAAKIGAMGYDDWKETEGDILSGRKDWYKYITDKLSESQASSPVETSPLAPAPKPANIAKVPDENYVVMTKPDGKKVKVRADLVEKKRAEGYK